MPMDKLTGDLLEKFAKDEAAAKAKPKGYVGPDGEPINKSLTSTNEKPKIDPKWRAKAIESGVTGEQPVKKARGGMVKGVGVAKRGFGKGKLT